MKVLLTATVQSHICQFHKPLVEMLHEHNYEVHVAARNNLAEKNGLKLDFVEKVFDIPFARSPLNKNNIKAYRELKKIIAEGDYDVIHCNTPVGGVLTRLAARDVRKKGCKVYYTAHGFHFYKGCPINNWIYYPIEKYLANHYTDKLITINNEDYELAKKKFKCVVEHIHGVGVDEKRFYPVSETEKIKLRKEFGYNKEQKLILCIGELLPNKNQQMAIHMMDKLVKEYPNTLLLISGNGPEKDNLEKLVQDLNLTDHIKFLGYVTNVEIYQRITDVVISCSKREGLPTNIVESMLSGTPVVVSNNRGHRELVQDGKNGYLVDVDDVEMMKNKILSSFNSEDLHNKIVLNVKTIEKEYSSSSIKKKLNNIYFN